MKILRTPDERFAELKDFPYEPNYTEIQDGEDGTLRIHYVDEGSRTADPIVLMHGEPTWCYLYRKMIPILVSEGYRVVAPDLIGFGRSDKPSEHADYTYQRHVDWMLQWLEQVNLNRITLFCQDWRALYCMPRHLKQPCITVARAPQIHIKDFAYVLKIA